MKMASEGIFFVATGEFHRAEALSNARASRTFADGRPIILVTDSDAPGELNRVFDQVHTHPDPVHGYRDKISAMLRLPFAQTLFLDSDARLTAPAGDLFQALGRADLAAVQAPVRLPPGWCDSSVPRLFSEINSGVLLWRRSRKQRALVREWLKLYDRLQVSTGQTWDQASLRSVLWKFIQKNRFKLAVLPAEANFRTTKPWIAGRGLPVHVLHGRVPSDEEEDLVHFLNDNVDRFRTWVEWKQRFPESKLRLRIGENSPRPGHG